MEWYRIYQEVCNEIEFLGFRIDDLEGEYRFWYRQCTSRGRKPAAPLDACLNRMNQICDNVREYAYLLELKENTKNQMDKQLEGLGELESRVIHLNLIEGMTLKEVGEELGYSEIWIKKISSRSKKKLVV